VALEDQLLDVLRDRLCKVCRIRPAILDSASIHQHLEYFGPASIDPDFHARYQRFRFVKNTIYHYFDSASIRQYFYPHVHPHEMGFISSRGISQISDPASYYPSSWVEMGSII
jgi:hypothetical protein